jgi:hypothetical protein
MIEFHAAKKNHGEISKNIFALFIEVLQSTDAPLVTG